MHSSTLGMVLALLLPLFTTTTISSVKENASTHSSVLKSTYSALEIAYQNNENITVVDLEGNQYHNPNLEELQSLSPALFSENRVRVTLENYSDNGKCSTELVLFDEDGGLVRNYSLNTCDSYGWIIFTNAECFDIDIYHDAGQEAPFGGAISGSVDWTFTFNQMNRITGTYFDGGSAKMYTVASPCFKDNKVTLLDRPVKSRLPDTRKPFESE